MIKVGIIGEVKDKVSENNIAKALRSGELNVYATPALSLIHILQIEII